MADTVVHDFLSQFSMLSDTEKSALAEKLNVKYFKKKTILQKEGDVPHSCFFVLKGCIRQYCMMEGVEKTLEFYTADNAAISSDDYLNQKPSAFSLVCTEDSIILVGEQERDAKLIAEFPKLPTILMQVTEKEWLKAQSRLSLFKLSSPEKRYEDFLKQRPDLIQRVPASQIASYLGITPESLSRIRKRLLSKS